MSSLRLSAFIFLAIAIGIAFPLGPSAKPLIGVFLGVMLFLNFCRFNPKAATFMRIEILPAMLLWIVVMPLLTLGGRYFMSSDHAMGLYLVAITPAAMGSPVIVHHLRGNFELSVAFVVLSSFLAPVVVPFSLLVSWGTDAVSPWQIFWNIFGLLAVPMLAAVAVRQVKRWTPFVTKLTHRSNEVFVLLVYAAVATVADRLRALPMTTLLVLAAFAFALALVQFGAGYLMARERAVRLALSVGIGQKNTGMSLWIAVMFLHPETALVPVLYIIAQHTVSGLMMASSGRSSS